jgi:RNA:NAD 2'-phosphotransferase (TPT1/KptA family)
MDERELIFAGRKIVRLLRHTGLHYNLDFDSGGYVSIQQLLRCQVVSYFNLSKNDLDWIIKHNNKSRLGYNEDETRIRCHQGHSGEIYKLLDIDKIYRRVEDPMEIIPCMHGTYHANLQGIHQNGLLPMSRHMVHLTKRKDFFRKSVQVVIHIDVEKAGNC